MTEEQSDSPPSFATTPEWGLSSAQRKNLDFASVALLPPPPVENLGRNFSGVLDWKCHPRVCHGFFFFFGSFDVNAPWWGSETLEIPTETKRYYMATAVWGQEVSWGHIHHPAHSSHGTSHLRNLSARARLSAMESTLEGAIVGDTTLTEISLITYAPIRA